MPGTAHSILYVITRAELGGAQIHVAELLRHFRHSYKVHLACGEEGWLTKQAQELAVPTYHLPDMVRRVSPRSDFRAWASLRALVGRLQPTIVHSHSSKAGVLARLCGKTPMIFTAHGWAFSDGAPWAQRVLGVLSEHLVGRRKHTVITVSHHDRMLAQNFFLHHRYAIETVWNGVHDTPHRADLFHDRTVRIACVARFVKQKDHATLLTALAKISSPWTLDLIGSGPLEGQLKILASNLSIAKQVRFLGARQDVDELLSRADIFVLPTRQEGLPLTILEAMRAGLPVIASATGGVPELISDGENGFLVNVGEVKTLTVKLATLIEDRAGRIRMGATARRRYEEYFTVQTMLSKTGRIYDKALMQNH